MHLSRTLTRSTVALVAAVAVILGWTPTAAGQTRQTDRGLGIGLIGGPQDRADQVGAGRAIYDAAPPGTERTWQLRIENDTAKALPVDLFVVDVTLGDAGIVFGAGPSTGPLGDWVTIRPDDVVLEPRQSLEVFVDIAVPVGASPEEQVGAIVAQPPASAGTIQSIQRVAVPIFFVAGDQLDLGDFVIDSMTPRRLADGAPAVDILVQNTGSRTLSVSGQLTLLDGPGGLSVAPAASVNAPTVQVGATGMVTFVFDEALPVGPWTARAVLSGGALERGAQAVITFPEVGEETPPGAVPAEPFELDRGTLLPINVALLVLVVLGLLLWWASNGRVGGGRNDVNAVE